MRILRSFGLVVLALITMSEAVEDVEALRSVWSSVDQFSSPFFQTAQEFIPGNLILSPVGINIDLAMISLGARGNTEAQFRNVLHLPTSESLVTSGYQSLIDNLNSIKDNKLAVANKAFMASGLNLKPSYKNLTEVYFRSSLQKVNFDRERETADIINSWVEENTNHLVKEVVTAGKLNARTRLVLVNAMYFKGQWKDKFDPELTKDMQFHTKDGPKSASIMKREGKYKYGNVPDLNARFVVIPYKVDELSMVIILPNKGINSDEYIRNINLTNILSNGEKQIITLYLPKFKVESILDLGDILPEMGLSDAFSSHADFSGIADGNLDLSNVIQKAYIEVDEKGNTVSSSNSDDVEAVSRDSIMKFSDSVNTQFRINRPFYYYVIKTMEDAVGHDIHLQLFCGFVSEPKF
ncbi:antichymotrypsin-2-like isoform X2 [Bombus pyrosoma]|uniref:antichymotrypsin-2-like isoform X2 n=1 Tax=Bombus pyrosoma TaxID=396416 RepID=UPI001CB9B290|nr:antichymotrypsin-2-like isoform X2 [Bombus pyrosoma]